MQKSAILLYLLTREGGSTCRSLQYSCTYLQERGAAHAEVCNTLVLTYKRGGQHMQKSAILLYLLTREGGSTSRSLQYSCTYLQERGAAPAEVCNTLVLTYKRGGQHQQKSAILLYLL